MRCRDRMGSLIRCLIAVWLALTPVAAIGQGAGQDARPDLRLVVTTSDVGAGQWTMVTLENATPGHVGYFTAAAPLDYAAFDGSLKAYPYLVTVGADGRARAQIRSFDTGNWLIRFEDMSIGQTLPVTAVLHVGQSTPSALPAADIGWAFIHSTTYPPGRYLKGVEAINHVVVDYSLSDNKSGKVLLLRNNQVVGEAAVKGCGEKEFTVNMGSEDFAFVNELRAVVEIDGQRSKLSQEFFFTQLPGAGLFNGIKFVHPFRIEGRGADTLYVAEAEYPVDGFLYSSPGFISTDVAKLTQHNTWLRGRLSLPVRCEDSGRLISLSGGASYVAKTQLWVVPLSGGFKASGDLTASNPDCNVLAFELRGVIKSNATLTGAKNWELKDFYKDVLGDYFPTLATLLGLTSYGTVGFRASLGVEAESDATLKPSSPYFQSKLGLEAGLDIKGTLDRYVFPIYWLTADLTKTGGRFLFNSDARSSEFDKLYSSAAYGYHANIWWGCIWGLCKPSIWDLDGGCSYVPSSGNQCQVDKGSVAAAAVDAPRATALFVSNADAGWSNPASTSLALISDTLVGQVYPFSQVSLASEPGSDRVLAVWDHDEPGLSWRQSAELQSSLWDGVTWSAPITLTGNTRQDFGPQVAWTHGGQAVAVWQQAATTLPASDPSLTITQEIEIASAAYDASTGRWTASTLLTDNAAVDVGVRLARNGSGQLLAAWVQSDASLAPDQPGNGQIETAFHAGVWNAAATAVADIDPMAELAVGYGADKAVIAYTQGITPVGASQPVQQIFITTWDGAGWSLPQPLAADALDQRSPNVLFNSLNQPVIVWLAGDAAIRLLNLTTGVGADAPLGDGHGTTDMLRAVRDAAGNIAALWRSQGEAFDLNVAWYDQFLVVWGAPRRITGDARWERLPAAVLSSARQLRVAYLSTAYDAYSDQITLPDGVTIPAPVSVMGLTDLNVLGYTFDRNLTLLSGEMRVDNAHPLPGETVILSATVHNTGDLPLENVTVSFYDGNPALGGALIAEAPVAGVLAAGYAVTVSTGFIAPVSSGIRTFFAVADAGNLIAEQDEGDNQDSLRAFGPDLAFTSAELLSDWGNVVKLRARVSNLGTGVSLPTRLLVFQRAAGMDAVAEMAIPGLQPGESHTVSLPWDHGLQAAGLHPIEATVNLNDFDEVDRENNLTVLSMPVGVDLALSPFNLEIGDMSRSQTPVTITVVNAGPVAVTDAVVVLHNFFTRDAASMLVTYPLPSLARGEVVVVNTIVPGPLTCGLYATVAAPKEDIDEMNNYVSVAGAIDCSVRVFLPQVSR